MLWRQIGARLPEAVPSVQIKNVPDDVHRVLRRRAVEAGQSLQEYLLARLTEEAARPTLDEVLRRAGERASGDVSLAEATRAVRTDRDAR
jgi:plasmid stability protein